MRTEMKKLRTRTEMEKLRTRKWAADFLGLRVQTLARWGMDGRHLPVIKVGRSVRYRESDLQRFIEKQTVPASD